MVVNGVKINGVTCDSRKVREGYAFVAIKGENEDGNFFIDEAIENGATIIYTEKDVTDKKVPVIKVNNARKTLAELCNAFYGYPSEKLKLVGVTGTNGKTTTTHLIYQMLRDYGIPAGLIGTLNIKINDKEYGTELTTPASEKIYHYLSMMVEENVKVAVMEVSSHGLKTNRVHGLQFDIAIHTNIDRDHLYFHKTFEDYVLSKKILFDSLSEGKIAIINSDDDNGLKLLGGNEDAIVITYGLNEKSTITASSINLDLATSFIYCLQRGITTLSGIEIEPFEYPFLLKLIGKHNIYNALAAITCGLLVDIPLPSISKTVRNFQNVPRRMDIIYNEDYMIIDDFSHNPASYEAVLQSIQNMQYHNLHIVNAIRGSRGEDINRENAEVLREWLEILNCKTIMLTSSKDYVGPLDQVKESEKDAYFEVFNRAGLYFEYEETLSQAIAKTIQRLESEDILLLLGAQGMDQGKQVCLDMLRDGNSLYSQSFQHDNKQP